MPLSTPIQKRTMSTNHSTTHLRRSCVAFFIPILIITQEFSALPSDLRGYYAFEYSYSEKDYEYESFYDAFEKKLRGLFHSMDGIDDFSDSPVSDFLSR